MINSVPTVLQVVADATLLSVEDSAYVLQIDQNRLEFVATPAQGPAGPQGIQGVQGVPGLAGANYTHTQGIASTVWTINHNLDRYPSVTVIDSANTVIAGAQVVYTDSNTIVLSFSYAFAGKAYLN